MLDNIIFITPEHAFSFSQLKKIGCNVISPYKGKSIGLQRILREVCFRVIPWEKSIWFNKAAKQKCEIYFIYEALIVPEYIEWLKKYNPSARIILFYNNPVNRNNNPDKFNDLCCEKWTCDENDALKYKMNRVETGGYLKIWKVKKNIPTIDVFYVGKDKGRLDYLLSLEKQFKDLGLITYFHIVKEKRYQLNQNRVYKQFMPYEQVLEYLGRTKAILHLGQGAQKGITIRIQEALIHRIKMITDCKYVMNYDFYSENNFFILGVNDIETLPDFLKSPYKNVNSTFYNSPYFEDMINTILN